MPPRLRVPREAGIVLHVAAKILPANSAPIAAAKSPNRKMLTAGIAQAVAARISPANSVPTAVPKSPNLKRVGFVPNAEPKISPVNSVPTAAPKSPKRAGLVPIVVQRTSKPLFALNAAGKRKKKEKEGSLWQS